MKMHGLIGAVLVGAAGCLVGAGFAYSAGDEGEKGFTRLDSGKDLKGFAGNPTGWSVEDGAIHLNAKKAKGNLTTERTHSGNAVIRLQFKADKGADSGVFVWGKQLQVRDYPNAGPKQYAFAAKPHGEWNDLEFDIKNGVATVKLNGKVIEKAWKIGGNAKQGIGLQRERGDFWFRNIRLMERK